MAIKYLIKELCSNYIPFCVGRWAVNIPFSWRLGKEYTKTMNKIQEYNLLSLDEKNAYILSKLNKIISYATTKFDVYYKLYSEHGLVGKKLKYLDDFIQYPIITKEMVRRFTGFNGAMRVNTGGTSGEPMSFFLDKYAFAREWAHMHYLWQLRGYNHTDIKITLRGKNIGNKGIVYNPVHNEFIINTYKPVFSLKDELLTLFSKHEIKYVHGYPSTIYGFFKELEECLNVYEKDIITNKGLTCLFGSEFPLLYMIQYLQNNWMFNYLSWYGHSEMAVLAVDNENNQQYKPLQTYGHVEVEDDMLIGTSYNNFDMPLIRYDTGDRVKAEKDISGNVKYFQIEGGREGDYVIDRKGKKISLTALIYGRHHKVFDIAKYVQVSQEKNGKVILYITLDEGMKTKINSNTVDDLFDLTYVDIEYAFKFLDTPVRSKVGKLRLKI